MKKAVILFSVLMISVFAVKAQFSQFHVGVTFPSGDFGEYNKKSSSNKPQGLAATGFNLGYKYYSPLSVANLSLVFGVDIYYNGLQSDYKDDVTESYDEDVESGYYDDYELTFPSYLNIPVTAGINYAYPLNEKIKAYGEFALGLNYSMVTNYKEEWTDPYGDDDEFEQELDPAFGFAYALEAGLFINDRFSVGLRYNNLGSYNWKDQDGDKIYGKKSLAITNVALVLGITF